MRILVIHNHYQHPGGEDRAFAAEVDLLLIRGNEVLKYEEDNHLATSISRLGIVTRTIWSRESYRKILRLIRQFRPEIVHIHNTFFAISPSVYYACQAEGVPVVQTLHNYRLLCPVATFYRDRMVCEECLGKFIPWPSVYHGCYHHSRIQTASVAGMLSLHRIAKTWQIQVDQYIALTEFARLKFIQSGLPAEKIVVKPNFFHPDPGPKSHSGDFVIFIGRLSPEKGINTLIEAWKTMKTDIQLKVVGSGPLQEQVASLAQADSRVEFLGAIFGTNLLTLMKSARILVFPSESYEGFPMVIAEAFACGLPVIAPNLGSSREIVTDNNTGLLFQPGNSVDLATKVKWAWEHPFEMAKMGKNARREYEEKYTAEKNYDMLMDIYRQAIEAYRSKIG
ncbi:MAG: glycosyltransferase family 4 protein [Chloroflexota bacterium]